MWIKKTFTYFFIVLIAGCATPPVAPKFTWGQTVDFEGYIFKFNSARITTSYPLAGKTVTASDAFVIVDVSITNKTGNSVPPHFRPIFQLIDANGSAYVSSLTHELRLGYGKPERLSPMEAFNPNTNLRKELVFEAPKGNYSIQAIVPSRAQVGFGGGIKSMGPYFIYDISSQL